MINIYFFKLIRFKSMPEGYPMIKFSKLFNYFANKITTMKSILIFKFQILNITTLTLIYDVKHFIGLQAFLIFFEIVILNTYYEI